jgi:hypothetical protein
MMKKKFDADNWSPTMYQDVHKFCQTCDLCQITRKLMAQNMAKLITTLPKEPSFKNWDWISLDPSNRGVITLVIGTF